MKCLRSLPLLLVFCGSGEPLFAAGLMSQWWQNSRSWQRVTVGAGIVAGGAGLYWWYRDRERIRVASVSKDVPVSIDKPLVAGTGIVGAGVDFYWPWGMEKPVGSVMRLRSVVRARGRQPVKLATVIPAVVCQPILEQAGTTYVHQVRPPCTCNWCEYIVASVHMSMPKSLTAPPPAGLADYLISLMKELAEPLFKTAAQESSGKLCFAEECKRGFLLMEVLIVLGVIRMSPQGLSGVHDQAIQELSKKWSEWWGQLKNDSQLVDRSTIGGARFNVWEAYVVDVWCDAMLRRGTGVAIFELPRRLIRGVQIRLSDVSKTEQSLYMLWSELSLCRADWSTYNYRIDSVGEVSQTWSRNHPIIATCTDDHGTLYRQ